MEERPRRWRSGGGKVERREGSGPAAEEASARRRGKKVAEGRMETKGSRNRSRRGRRNGRRRGESE